MSKGLITKPEDFEPDITGFDFYLEAFRDLGSCRLSSMGVGAIPFTAVVEYFKVYPVGEFEDFHYFIKIMDSKFLEIHHAKNNQTKKPTTKKG